MLFSMVILPKHALLLLLLSAVTSEDVAATSEDQQSLIALPRRKEGVIRNPTLDVPLEPEVLPRKSAVGFLLADGVDALDLRQDVSSSKGPETTVEKNWMTVYLLVVVIFISICPIAVKEGIRPFITVVVYLACLSLVKMWVKEAMNNGFPYPETITAVHMLSTSLAAACLERPKLSEALMVLPISVVNGASLLTNNTALLYGGVAFVSMVSSCTPMFTFFMELLRRRRSLDFLTAFSVVLVCCGSTCCVRGEKMASIFAFGFASMAACLRAMKSVWQHELLTVSVSPLRLVFWSGFWSFFITIFMVSLTEGTQGIRHFGALKPEAQSAFGCSIASAVALNISQCFAVKQLGALMQSIVGNLNLILIIALSQAWLQEKVTIWQYVGVLLLAVGTFTNKYGDLQLKAAKAEQAKLIEKAQAAEVAAEAAAEGDTEAPKYGALQSSEKKD